MSVWSGLPVGDRRLVECWRGGLGFNRAAPVDVLLSLLDVGEARVLWRADLPAEVMDAAVVHRLSAVRAEAADSGRLSAVQWERLVAATPSPRLRALLAEAAAEEAAVRRWPGVPPSTPEEIAVLAAAVPHIDPADRSVALWWVRALFGDAEAMRQLAGSPRLLVRRSVARAPRLPADVVAVLAGDPDRVVRLFLAESCDDAPAEMLVEVAGWWDGSLSFPGRPQSHPNFPRAGLLRFAADGNPRLRALALRDPESAEDLVERFAGDSSPVVREAAARDERLSVASLLRLADDDEESVRRAARLHPGLPVDRLVALLGDKESAGWVVRNPAIPVEVMRWMVAGAAVGVSGVRKGRMS